MTALQVMTAVRECGGRFAISDQDGRLVLRGAKRVPTALVDVE